MTVGTDYGVRNVGYYSLRFLRIEKFIPFWGEELDSNTTPYEVGRGHKVKLDVILKHTVTKSRLINVRM